MLARRVHRLCRLFPLRDFCVDVHVEPLFVLIWRCMSTRVIADSCGVRGSILQSSGDPNSGGGGALTIPLGFPSLGHLWWRRARRWRV